MFRKLALSLAACAALIVQLALPASAELGVGGFAVRDSLASSSPVESAQFVWGGRNYCWYNSACKAQAGTGAAMRGGADLAGEAAPAGTAGTIARSTGLRTSFTTTTGQSIVQATTTGRTITIGPSIAPATAIGRTTTAPPTARTTTGRTTTGRTTTGPATTVRPAAIAAAGTIAAAAAIAVGDSAAAEPARRSLRASPEISPPPSFMAGKADTPRVAPDPVAR